MGHITHAFLRCRFLLTRSLAQTAAWCHTSTSGMPFTALSCAFFFETLMTRSWESRITLRLSFAIATCPTTRHPKHPMHTRRRRSPPTVEQQDRVRTFLQWPAKFIRCLHRSTNAGRITQKKGPLKYRVRERFTRQASLPCSNRINSVDLNMETMALTTSTANSVSC